MTSDMANQFILVAGSQIDGLPVPLVMKPHLQDILDYIKEKLKYYPYEYLAIYTVNLADALNINVVGNQIIVQ